MIKKTILFIVIAISIIISSCGCVYDSSLSNTDNTINCKNVTVLYKMIDKYGGGSNCFIETDYGTFFVGDLNEEKHFNGIIIGKKYNIEYTINNWRERVIVNIEEVDL